MRNWISILIIAAMYSFPGLSPAADESHNRQRAAANSSTTLQWPLQGKLYPLTDDKGAPLPIDQKRVRLERNRELIIAAAKLIDQDLPDACAEVTANVSTDYHYALWPKTFFYNNFQPVIRQILRTPYNPTFFCPAEYLQWTAEQKKQHQDCMTHFVMQTLMQGFANQYQEVTKELGMERVANEFSPALIEFGTRATAGWGKAYPPEGSLFTVSIFNAAKLADRLPQGLALEAALTMNGQRAGGDTLEHEEALRRWALDNLRAKKLESESLMLLRQLDERPRNGTYCEYPSYTGAIPVWAPLTKRGWSQRLANEDKAYYLAEAKSLKDLKPEDQKELIKFASLRKTIGEPFTVQERIHFQSFDSATRKPYLDKAEAKIKSMVAATPSKPASYLIAESNTSTFAREAVAELNERYKEGSVLKSSSVPIDVQEMLLNQPPQLLQALSIASVLMADYDRDAYSDLLANPDAMSLAAALEKWGPLQLQPSGGEPTKEQTNKFKIDRALKLLDKPVTNEQFLLYFESFYAAQTGKSLGERIKGQDPKVQVSPDLKVLVAEVLRKAKSDGIASPTAAKAPATVQEEIARLQSEFQLSNKHVKNPSIQQKISKDDQMARANLISARLNEIDFALTDPAHQEKEPNPEYIQWLRRVQDSYQQEKNQLVLNLYGDRVSHGNGAVRSSISPILLGGGVPAAFKPRPDMPVPPIAGVTPDTADFNALAEYCIAIANEIVALNTDPLKGGFTETSDRTTRGQQLTVAYATYCHAGNGATPAHFVREGVQARVDFAGTFTRTDGMGGYRAPKPKSNWNTDDWLRIANDLQLRADPFPEAWEKNRRAVLDEALGKLAVKTSEDQIPLPANLTLGAIESLDWNKIDRSTLGARLASFSLHEQERYQREFNRRALAELEKNQGKSSDALRLYSSLRVIGQNALEAKRKELASKSRLLSSLMDHKTNSMLPEAVEKRLAKNGISKADLADIYLLWNSPGWTFLNDDGVTAVRDYVKYPASVYLHLQALRTRNRWATNEHAQLNEAKKNNDSLVNFYRSWTEGTTVSEKAKAIERRLPDLKSVMDQTESQLKAIEALSDHQIADMHYQYQTGRLDPEEDGEAVVRRFVAAKQKKVEVKPGDHRDLDALKAAEGGGMCAYVVEVLRSDLGGKASMMNRDFLLNPYALQDPTDPKNDKTVRAALTYLHEERDRVLSELMLINEGKTPPHLETCLRTAGKGKPIIGDPARRKVLLLQAYANLIHQLEGFDISPNVRGLVLSLLDDNFQESRNVGEQGERMADYAKFLIRVREAENKRPSDRFVIGQIDDFLFDKYRIRMPFSSRLAYFNLPNIMKARIVELLPKMANAEPEERIAFAKILLNPAPHRVAQYLVERSKSQNAEFAALAESSRLLKPVLPPELANLNWDTSKLNADTATKLRTWATQKLNELNAKKGSKEVQFTDQKMADAIAFLLAETDLRGHIKEEDHKSVPFDTLMLQASHYQPEFVLEKLNEQASGEQKLASTLEGQAFIRIVDQMDAFLRTRGKSMLQNTRGELMKWDLNNLSHADAIQVLKRLALITLKEGSKLEANRAQVIEEAFLSGDPNAIFELGKAVDQAMVDELLMVRSQNRQSNLEAEVKTALSDSTTEGQRKAPDSVSKLIGEVKGRDGFALPISEGAASDLRTEIHTAITNAGLNPKTTDPNELKRIEEIKNSFQRKLAHDAVRNWYLAKGKDKVSASEKTRVLDLLTSVDPNHNRKAAEGVWKQIQDSYDFEQQVYSEFDLFAAKYDGKIQSQEEYLEETRRRMRQQQVAITAEVPFESGDLLKKRSLEHTRRKQQQQQLYYIAEAIPSLEKRVEDLGPRTSLIASSHDPVTKKLAATKAENDLLTKSIDSLDREIRVIDAKLSEVDKARSARTEALDKTEQEAYGKFLTTHAGELDKLIDSYWAEKNAGKAPPTAEERERLRAVFDNYLDTTARGRRLAEEMVSRFGSAERAKKEIAAIASADPKKRNRNLNPETLVFLQWTEGRLGFAMDPQVAVDKFNVYLDEAQAKVNQRTTALATGRKEMEEKYGFQFPGSAEVKLDKIKLGDTTPADREEIRKYFDLHASQYNSGVNPLTEMENSIVESYMRQGQYGWVPISAHTAVRVVSENSKDPKKPNIKIEYLTINDPAKHDRVDAAKSVAKLVDTWMKTMPNCLTKHASLVNYYNLILITTMHPKDLLGYEDAPLALQEKECRELGDKILNGINYLRESGGLQIETSEGAVMTARDFAEDKARRWQQEISLHKEIKKAEMDEDVWAQFMTASTFAVGGPVAKGIGKGGAMLLNMGKTAERATTAAGIALRWGGRLLGTAPGLMAGYQGGFKLGLLTAAPSMAMRKAFGNDPKEIWKSPAMRQRYKEGKELNVPDGLDENGDGEITDKEWEKWTPPPDRAFNLHHQNHTMGLTFMLQPRILAGASRYAPMGPAVGFTRRILPNYKEFILGTAGAFGVAYSIEKYYGNNTFDALVQALDRAMYFMPFDDIMATRALLKGGAKAATSAVWNARALAAGMNFLQDCVMGGVVQYRETHRKGDQGKMNFTAFTPADDLFSACWKNMVDGIGGTLYAARNSAQQARKGVIEGSASLRPDEIEQIKNLLTLQEGEFRMAFKDGFEAEQVHEVLSSLPPNHPTSKRFLEMSGLKDQATLLMELEKFWGQGSPVRSLADINRRFNRQVKFDTFLNHMWDTTGVRPPGLEF